MEERQLTGDSMRGMVQDLCDRSNMEQWNDWYRRILIKDLRCGVSQKTVNNVSKKMGLKYSVPVFSCMLAHDGAKHPKKIQGKCLVEYKYDVPFSVCEEDLESPHDVEVARDNSTLRVVCPPGLQ